MKTARVTYWVDVRPDGRKGCAMFTNGRNGLCYGAMAEEMRTLEHLAELGMRMARQLDMLPLVHECFVVLRIARDELIDLGLIEG